MNVDWISAAKVEAFLRSDNPPNGVFLSTIFVVDSLEGLLDALFDPLFPMDECDTDVVSLGEVSGEMFGRIDAPVLPARTSEREHE